MSIQFACIQKELNLVRFAHNWNAGKMGLKEEKQFINDFFRFYYPTFHPSNALAGGYVN